MQTQRFDFTGAEGQLLSGRLDLPDGLPRAFAVFVHCFTCSKNSLAAVRIARALAARGIGTLRFDFTGLGESEGAFADATFSSNIGDLHAAIRHMSEREMAPALLIGHSLGGAAVLASAGELPVIKAVAVIGAPFDVEHVTRLFGDELDVLREKGEAKVNLGGRSFLVRRAFVEDLRAHELSDRIAGLQRPLLVLHSPRDRIVDIDNAGRIFQAARHPKSFVSLDDADHLLTRAIDADYAAEVIAAWASRYVDADSEDVRPAPSGLIFAEETGVGRFQVQITAGQTRLFADEPVDVGGLGSGPSPYDLLGAALGACTAMTARVYADRKSWPLARVRVSVGHTKAGDKQPGDRFLRAVDFEGELTTEQRARLLEIVDRCPVHRTLEAGAEIHTCQADVGAGPECDRPSRHLEDVERACGSDPQA